jgi:hypothetical protein
MREPLLSDVPFPPIELHPAVPEARALIGAATRDLIVVPDAALESDWPWRDSQADVRYGFYHACELLDAGSAAVRRVLDETGARRAPGARVALAATGARWDLHGRLLPLDDAALDAPPGGEEWTVRQTLGHIVNGQRSYGRYSAWWLLQRDAPSFADRAPEDLGPPMPDEVADGQGTLTEIRDRLDGLLDAGMAAFGGLDEAALAVPGRWAGFRVDLGFRIGRWGSHIREHTVQVDKTLAMIGWAPREVDRLVGLLLSAWGRLEAEVFGLPPAALDLTGSGGTAAGIVASVARRVAEDGASIRAAASPPV